MTHEKIEDPAGDIAWMRRLAEEGSATPMQGAGILLGAGLIYGTASLGHWAVFSDLIGGGVTTINIIWLTATALFFAVLAINIMRLRRSEGVRTAANRASATAWAAVGWGIFALFASLFVLSWKLGGASGQVGLALAPSMIMVFYGVGWAVSAAMQRAGTLWLLAIGSFIAAPLLAALTGMAEQYLAYAAALYLLAGLPGWFLMRAARG